MLREMVLAFITDFNMGKLSDMTHGETKLACVQQTHKDRVNVKLHIADNIGDL